LSAPSAEQGEGGQRWPQIPARYNIRLLRCSGEALLDELRAVGADPRGAAIMAPKGQHYVFRVERVTFAAASILKQEMLAKDGEAALSGEIYFGGERTTDILLMGNARTYQRVLAVLRVQPLPSLRALAEELDDAIRSIAVRQPITAVGTRPTCRIGNREFHWGERTYVMGIVNATPDSFSGDGVFREQALAPAEAVSRALQQGLHALAQGADILDIGGESTRPGSVAVDAETELARVLPVIRALREHTDAPLSIDTYRSEVAQAALDAGADLVNDVWGLQMDPALAPLIAARQVPVVIMHNRSRPKDAAQEARLGGRYVGAHYQDLLGDILRDLRMQVQMAVQAGISHTRIIIDPGIGFGKTVEQNLKLLNHSDELRVLGLPVLMGPSRKSFIGYTLDLPPQERLEGTEAAVAVAIMRGAAIVRVHDVGPVVRLVRMTDAILRAE
jgi:dihydropteroate synthase